MTNELSLEQKACNFDTTQHIKIVQKILNEIAVQLIQRGMEHDKTKLEPPEVGLFVKYTPELAKTQYGSPEYLACLKNLKPALDHHYARNSHHPEFHKNGINDFSLLELVECLADWKAASLRQNNGNIRKSLELNAERFQIGPQLLRILENTLKDIPEGNE